MDDILCMSGNAASAQLANKIMEELTGKKSLQLNKEKSSYIIMGNKKARRNLSSQLVRNPLILEDEPMKEEKSIKYLGDWLSINLEESVHQTVVKRVAVAKLSVYEIRRVIEDTRAQRLGAVSIAFDIYEKALLAALLYNCESWLSLPKKTLRVLDNFFHFFCRTIFRVPVSCPKINFYFASASMTFSNLILQRKLNFAFHLSNLEEGSLARTIWEEQVVQRDLPGLSKEIADHISSMGMEIEDLQGMSKCLFRRKVRQYVENKNKEELLVDLRRYKKLNYEKVASEPFVRKPYFFKQDLESARTLFRISSALVPTIKAYYPNKYRRRGIPLTCPSCPPLSSASASSENSSTMEPRGGEPPLHSMSHILEDCLLVSDLRSECTVSDDKSLADFFKRVVTRHMELNIDQIIDY